jgi:predicted small metal-binding protein
LTAIAVKVQRHREEVLKHAAAHAQKDHGLASIDPGTLAKVKAAIRTV